MEPIPYTGITSPAAKQPETKLGPAGEAIAQSFLDKDGAAGKYEQLRKELQTKPEGEVLRRWAKNKKALLRGLGHEMLMRQLNAGCAAVFDPLLELYPDDEQLTGYALYYRGTALQNSGHHERAFRDLDRLVTEFVDEDVSTGIPASYALNNLAWAHFQLGTFEEGVPIARRAVEEDPRNGAAVNTLGCLLYLAGDEDEGVEQFERSLEIGVKLGPEDVPEAMRQDPRIRELLD